MGARLAEGAPYFTVIAGLVPAISLRRASARLIGITGTRRRAAAR
jgi:hypothetical protein